MEFLGGEDLENLIYNRCLGSRELASQILFTNRLIFFLMDTPFHDTSKSKNSNMVIIILASISIITILSVGFLYDHQREISGEKITTSFFGTNSQRRDGIFTPRNENR